MLSSSRAERRRLMFFCLPVCSTGFNETTPPFDLLMLAMQMGEQAAPF